MRLGVCIGEWTTHTVVMDDRKLLYRGVTRTVADEKTSVEVAIKDLLDKGRVDPRDIDELFLSTRFVEGAIKKRMRLGRVAVVRLAEPESRHIYPLLEWPRGISEAVLAGVYTAHGGHNFDGSEIAPLEERELKEIAEKIGGEVDGVAVVSPFSIIYPDHELEAVEVLREKLGPVPIMASHLMGKGGIVLRESTAVANVAIIRAFKESLKTIKSAVEKIGLSASLYIFQNDGTIANINYAAEYPLLNVKSELAASLRGASFLTNIEDGAIARIEKEKTAIGFLVRGFPREADFYDLEGVPINSRTPDMRVIVKRKRMITNEDLEKLIDRIKMTPDDIPLMITGEELAPIEELEGASKVIRPEYAEVADAVGVATANVGIEVDKLFPPEISKENAIKKASKIAESMALGAGADRSTVKVVEVTEVLTTAFPKGVIRIRVRVMGNLTH